MSVEHCVGRVGKVLVTEDVTLCLVVVMRLYGFGEIVLVTVHTWSYVGAQDGCEPNSKDLDSSV